jgi:glutathione peroxidase
MANAYDFAFKGIDGGELPLSSFKGKAVLVVNTASRCGLTPQYEGLEALWKEWRDKGLVVLGVPCNQFAGQEPGSETEIKDFCDLNFGVDFPMTAKVEVKDAGRHPFYAWAETKLGPAAVPVWNFHKILIGKDGEAIAAFGPRTEPKDPEIEQAVANAV